MPTLADQLLQEAGPKPPAVHASNEGAVVLLRHRFDAGEGEMGHPHQLRLGMAVGGGGRLQQHTLNGLLQASWRPGQFNLVLPADTGTYVSPSVDLIGIAIDTRMLPHNVQTLHHLQPLAARLHRDPVVSAVLTALWCSTQADACPASLSMARRCCCTACASLPANLARHAAPRPRCRHDGCDNWRPTSTRSTVGR
ncbi:hypothetical protein [Stenotrophomonas geniculata]|jgi:AraC family transcriptional regulator|uniref:hypothetical protein n=1 Tax=Stenotrophomonas geniculata TaxID=86188 RepID=UPI000A98FA40|nr:hypothetical protein [Stenotrophomonas geniculata]MDH7551341.1 hypothetical protein [Stenotrophomonas geniculata]